MHALPLHVNAALRLSFESINANKYTHQRRMRGQKVKVFGVSTLLNL